MTLQECKENHKKLWNWIADESEKRGYPVWKTEYFVKILSLEFENHPKNCCYVCEYASQIAMRKGENKDMICENCPLTIKPISKYRCIQIYEELYLSYIRWHNVQYCEDLKKYILMAREIANLSFEEEEI